MYVFGIEILVSSFGVMACGEFQGLMVLSLEIEGSTKEALIEPLSFEQKYYLVE